MKDRSQREVAAVAEALPTSSADEASVPEGSASLPDDPDLALAEIRGLVAADFGAARRLAKQTAERFPGHRGLQEAKRVLNEGQARVVPGSQGISREEEFGWLQDPPRSARGKWVALVGTAMVAAADTLQELGEALRSRHFAKPPLVHRVD